MLKLKVCRLYGKKIDNSMLLRWHQFKLKFKAPNFYLHIIIICIIFALQLNAINILLTTLKH